MDKNWDLDASVTGNTAAKTKTGIKDKPLKLGAGRRRVRAQEQRSLYLGPDVHSALKPYQGEGARFLAARKYAGLWDDMGLGKSAQAIAACDLIDANKILVIAPAVALWNWKREFERWQTIERNVVVVDEKYMARLRNRGKKRGVKTRDKSLDDVRGSASASSYDARYFMPRADVLIISYHRMERYKKSLLGELLPRNEGYGEAPITAFDVLIADEAHYLKNHDAKRTRAFYGYGSRGAGVARQSERVWLLTGTPAPNDPSEIWTHCFALWPKAIGNKGYSAFVERYCSGYDDGFRFRITGGQNLDELRDNISNFIIRRRKDDVLKELPPIRVAEVLVDAKNRYDLRTIEAHAKRGLNGDLLRNVEQAMIETRYVKENGETPYLDELLSGAIGDAHISEMRRMVGALKAPVTVDLIVSETIDNHEKYVVFAYHKEVISILMDGLTAAGLEPVKIDGSMNSAQKQDAVDRFQTDPKCRVFVGQMLSAGTAITLTAAANVLIVEPSWVPADNAQALMRVYRLGQNRPVLARFVTLLDSIDESITEVITRKTRMVGALIDG